MSTILFAQIITFMHSCVKNCKFITHFFNIYIKTRFSLSNNNFFPDFLYTLNKLDNLKILHTYFFHLSLLMILIEYIKTYCIVF